MPTYPADRGARVIADLRPTTTLVHRKTAACLLPERMAHYATPGVSIAVVDDRHPAQQRHSPSAAARLEDDSCRPGVRWVSVAKGFLGRAISNLERVAEVVPAD